MNASTAAPRPSIFSANLLYLSAMIIVLVAGSMLQNLHFGWGLLATEILIGLLALGWVRANRLPPRAALRLRTAPASAVLLAFLMGLGVWLVDTWLGGVTSILLGYEVPAPPGIYPQSILAALLLFTGFVIAAPIGEELMFRGYIQVAYERLRPAIAIVLVALLFSVFHLSLLGLPPRIPVALALGYVAWRSGSLWPGVALHAANNLLAVFVLVVAARWPALLETLPIGTLPSAGAGLLVLLIAGWLFQRTASPHPSHGLTTLPERRGRLARSLPLALALLIFVVIVALEVILGRFPALLATGPLPLEEAPWPASQTLQYELLHRGGEPVGAATCELGRDDTQAHVGCELANRAFEFRAGNSFWSSMAAERTFDAAYNAADMALISLADSQRFGSESVSVDVHNGDENLRLHVASSISGASTTDITPDALVHDLWPWQLSALPFTAGAAYDATLVYPERWDNDLKRNVLTVTEEAVLVGGAEPVSVPAGDFLAWKVTVGNQTAWYSVEPPYILVQYEGSILTWRLAATE